MKIIERGIDYLLSVPERSAMASLTLITGIYTAASDLILPRFIKNSSSYGVTLGMLEKYLRENIARIESEEIDGDKSKEFIKKKIAGTAIEGMGLLAFRFSPMWFFAIVSDAAGGGKEYFNRLVDELKKNGLIDEDSDYTGIDELLMAVQSTSNRTARIIDMPPIDIEDAGKVASDILASYNDTARKAADLMPGVDEMWSRIKSMDASGVSYKNLSGMMTYDVLMKLQDKSRSAAISISNVTADMFDEFIMDSYRESLANISKDGYGEYFRKNALPYFKSSVRHFHPSRVTMTEKVINKLRSAKALRRK